MVVVVVGRGGGSAGVGVRVGVGIGVRSLRIARAIDATLGCVILNHRDVAPPPVERTLPGSCARLGGDILVRVGFGSGGRTGPNTGLRCGWACGAMHWIG